MFSTINKPPRSTPIRPTPIRKSLLHTPRKLKGFKRPATPLLSTTTTINRPIPTTPSSSSSSSSLLLSPRGISSLAPPPLLKETHFPKRTCFHYLRPIHCKPLSFDTRPMYQQVTILRPDLFPQHADRVRALAPEQVKAMLESKTIFCAERCGGPKDRPPPSSFPISKDLMSCYEVYSIASQAKKRARSSPSPDYNPPTPIRRPETPPTPPTLGTPSKPPSKRRASHTSPDHGMLVALRSPPPISPLHIASPSGRFMSPRSQPFGSMSPPTLPPKFSFVQPDPNNARLVLESMLPNRMRTVSREEPPRRVSFSLPTVRPCSVEHDSGSRAVEHNSRPSMVGQDSGPITVEHDSGPITVEHDSGPITVKHDSGPITVEHDSGPIPVEHESRPSSSESLSSGETKSENDSENEVNTFVSLACASPEPFSLSIKECDQSIIRSPISFMQSIALNDTVQLDDENLVQLSNQSILRSPILFVPCSPPSDSIHLHG